MAAVLLYLAVIDSPAAKAATFAAFRMELGALSASSGCVRVVFRVRARASVTCVLARACASVRF